MVSKLENTDCKKWNLKVPIKDKVDLLLGANANAMEKGANFVNSQIFLVNEQVFCFFRRFLYRSGCSPHICPVLNVSVIDRSSGHFKSRQAFSSTCRYGL